MKKKKAIVWPDKIHVGKHQLGWRNVDVYILPYAKGGMFQALPNETTDAEMCIGMDYEHWSDVFEVIMHEAHEFSLCDIGVGFRKQNVYAQTCSDGVFFMYNHNEHTEACARSAYFMANTYKLMYDWWVKIKAKG